MTTKRPSHPLVQGCTRRRIAEARLGSVDACDCGMLHVNVGAFTVRVESAALSDLSRLLQEALVELHSEQDTARADWTPQLERGQA